MVIDPVTNALQPSVFRFSINDQLFDQNQPTKARRKKEREILFTTTGHNI